MAIVTSFVFAGNPRKIVGSWEDLTFLFTRGTCLRVKSAPIPPHPTAELRTARGLLACETIQLLDALVMGPSG